MRCESFLYVDRFGEIVSQPPRAVHLKSGVGVDQMNMNGVRQRIDSKQQGVWGRHARAQPASCSSIVTAERMRSRLSDSHLRGGTRRPPCVDLLLHGFDLLFVTARHTDVLRSKVEEQIEHQRSRELLSSRWVQRYGREIA
jgi:hypothetical protein